MRAREKASEEYAAALQTREYNGDGDEGGESVAQVQAQMQERHQSGQEARGCACLPPMQDSAFHYVQSRWVECVFLQYLSEGCALCKDAYIHAVMCLSLFFAFLIPLHTLLCTAGSNCLGWRKTSE